MLRIAWCAALGLALAGCSGAKRSPGESEGDSLAAAAAGDARDAGSGAATAQADTRPLPPDAASPEACETYHRGLAGMVGRSVRAASGRLYYERAVRRWSEAPEACRDGRWHTAAAHLLRTGEQPLEAGDVSLASAREALTRGLDAPPDRELLVLVAFLGALGTGPELPPDACERARKAPPVPGPDYESEDRARYVCGHAALATGEFETAADELGAITMKVRYPDLPLRRAQAHGCAGDRGKARRFARAARKLDPTRAAMFGATAAEVERLLEQGGSRDLRRGRCASKSKEEDSE